MIHTVELRSKSSDFQSYLKLQNNRDLCHKYPGITITPWLIGTEEGKKQYKLKAKINLRRTIEPDNPLGIYSGQNAALILDAINQAFTELDLPTVTAWTLSRVDFTIDIKTQHLSQYLDILAHGDHKNRPLHKDNGLYIPYSSRGITVNFYSKAAEQEARDRDAAEQARDILRLEVECHDKKLMTMFSEAKLSRDLASLLMVDGGSPLIQMVNNTVGKELIKITGLCDHISKAAAIARIKETHGLQNRTKSQLVQLLDRINRKNGSVSISRERWPEAAGVTQRAFADRMNAFFRMGINPICLPSDSPVEPLESLYQLYLTALLEECSTTE